MEISHMINVAIVGVGNCASSLVQGVHYYRNARRDQFVPGLMHVDFGGYHIRDIKFVAAFDVDANKVGKDIAEAIFTPPNCTVKFSDVPELGVKVMKGPVLDGLGKYLKPVIPVDPTEKPVDVAKVLEEKDVDVMISYLPVGSYQASRFYAEQALKAGCGYINCIPEFIVSSREWGKRFEDAGIPCAGDDIKSQVGATILHRTLAKLLIDRGVRLEESYQLNVGGNSVTGDEEILLEVDGTLIRTEIGEFVDRMMKKYPPEDVNGKDVLNTNRTKEKIMCFTITDDYKLALVPVTKLIRHKICEPLIEVTLEEGHKIKVTRDHNLFTLDEDGNLKSIPAGELKRNKTFVIVPHRLSRDNQDVLQIDLSHCFNGSRAVRIDGEFLSIHNYPEIKIPVKFPITDEFLRVVGLWLADESLDNGQHENIEIAIGDDPECLANTWVSSFGIDCKLRGKEGVSIQVMSKTLESIVKRVFGLVGNCYSKRVPSWVFNLSDRQIAEVLKGYFSGDGGGVIGNQVRCSSASPLFVRDIQTLLLRLGIYSTIFCEKPGENGNSFASTEIWHCIISSREALGAFLKKVGFVQSRKNKLIRNAVGGKGSDKHFIPKIRLIKDADIKSTATSKVAAIEKETILAQLDRVKDKKIREKLRKLCDGDIRFVKVKNIKELGATSQHVYDLSVRNYERFICSNILVHNTDFLNMLEEERLSSKRISKTDAVASQIPYEVPLRIGPSDYVPFLKDNKVCYIHMRGRKFGDVPLTIDVKLSVEDSPNSAGVVIDAIRAVKLALDRGIGGPLIGVSAYFFKHPPVQMTDDEAKRAVEDFIVGRRRN